MSVRAVAAQQPAAAAQQATQQRSGGKQLQFMKYQGLGNDFILVRVAAVRVWPAATVPPAWQSSGGRYPATAC
jgi:hypothetical protein